MICVSILRASAVLLAGWLLACNAQAAPVSASGLLGARVTNLQGERLGEIRDLAVDVASGTVSYAILEAAATSRLDAQLSSVPLTALQPGLARDQLVVNAAADAPWRARLPEGEIGSHVMRARGILGMAIEHPSGADYGVIHDLVFELDTGRVLHAQVSLDAAPDGVKRDVPLGALRFPPAESHAILTLAQDGAAGTRKATDLIGMKVRNLDAGTTGRIEDLLIDLHNSRVHYAVLDMENRLITEPLERLAFSPGNDHAVLPAATTGIVEPRLELDRFSMSPRRENLVLAEPPSASAGASVPAGDGGLFERLDRDRDGHLEDTELDRPIAERRNWLAIDLDRDGRISRAEFAALRAE